MSVYTDAYIFSTLLHVGIVYQFMKTKHISRDSMTFEKSPETRQTKSEAGFQKNVQFSHEV